MLKIGLTRLANCQKVRAMSTAGSSVSKVTSTVEKVKGFMTSDGTKKAMQAAMIELRPPTPMEIPKAIGEAVRMVRQRNWKNLTVRDAWLNTLVATEVVCWFFVGECIGKGSLIGYQV